MEPLIQLLIVIIVIGAVIYLLEMIPMAEPFRVVVRVIAVLIALVFLLRVAGLVR